MGTLEKKRGRRHQSADQRCSEPPAEQGALPNHLGHCGFCRLLHLHRNFTTDEPQEA
ncbi:hypothetical protein Chor_015119 [Crotalus horridus]